MKFTISIIGCLLLSSCGFQLRGDQIPATLKKGVYIENATQSSSFSPFSTQLNQVLQSNHIQLVNKQQAKWILAIASNQLSNNDDNQVSSNQPRSYTFNQTLVFAIKTPNGKTCYGPITLANSQTITLSGNQLLSESGEVTVTKQNLATNLITQIYDHLASIDARKSLNQCRKVKNKPKLFKDARKRK